MSSRSGELAMRPLPSVLLDLHEEQVTGRLVLKRGRVSKTVDLVRGDLVGATSTQRDETLGHFLVSSGVITEALHREAVQRATGGGGKLGEALIALGALTEAELVEQLALQSRHKLVQALRWPQGVWRFEPVDEASEAAAGTRLPMIDVVLGGLGETASPDLDRLARFDGMRFELTPRGARLEPELRRVFGEGPIAMIAMVAEGAAIEDLERTFGDRVAARFAVDAMMLCDAVQASIGEFGLGTIASGELPARPAAPLEGDRPPAAVPVEGPVVAGPDLDGPAPAGPAAAVAAVAAAVDSPLFDILFDDIGLGEIIDGGSMPISLPEMEEIQDEDSGVVSAEEVVIASTEGDQASSARQALAAEHQRIQGADHYAVLLIGRRATGQEIEAAFTIRNGMLDHQARRVGEPRDRARVDEVRAAYAAARRVLCDERKRAAYDRELAGGELEGGVPLTIDTELGFRAAEELMGKGQWAQASEILRKVLERSPGEADYHAALGWAEWMAGGETPAAADAARVHLNAALEINPDHAGAHDHKGRIDAALHNDDAEALFHLERALDLDPGRREALAAIEGLLCARGELRRYERLLKRMLFRLRGRGTPAETHAWVRLGWLYLEHLADRQAAAAAAANARKLAPWDEDVAALVARVEAPAAPATPVRAGWREALGDPHSGAALVQTTRASGHIDAAFLAASTMVALGTADPQMTAMYESRRVRAVVLPGKPLAREQWALLRHKQDTVELGGLIELVAPAVHAVAPMTLADSELDPTQRIDDADLPPAFRRLRDGCATLLGVDVPAVYSRVELGAQVHVVATDPAVLIAGDDALTAPERPELVFSLARAMTFLWPGRTVGGSRPGRVLRAVVMAVFREASGTDVGCDDPLASAASEAVARLPAAARVNARAAALRLLSRGDGLNLSLWARSLARTADRAGLLLCGDIPAAFAGAREVGELDRDLVDFAFSAAHVQLRAQLGLSRA
ncbi:MAG TPA: tetratricopeptide repeat protein [Kofleriaceae bacterium]|nr:tetratricopeptide repeat protein [Kofleriaceae bacterium]